MEWLVIAATTLATIVALDSLWIGVVMKGFYRTHLGHLLAERFRAAPALLFYPLYTVGLTFFAVMPGIATGSLVLTAAFSAAFGMVAYATYDLTNHATLRNWPLAVTVVDIFWGAVLSGVAGAVAFVVSGLVL